jgi:hypothetical protein
MKILATVTLLLALAAGGLGYVNYRQTQSINTLNLQMSTLGAEVVSQHQAMLSYKKAIISLRSNQKQSDQAVVAILLYLKSQESDSSPKTEPNTYASGN